MKIIYDFLWWITGTSIWTWIVISSIVVALLLVLLIWCACVLAKESDEHSEKLFQELLKRKSEGG